jgi:hypothetical protein
MIQQEQQELVLCLKLIGSFRIYNINTEHVSCDVYSPTRDCKSVSLKTGGPLSRETLSHNVEKVQAQGRRVQYY